MNNDARVWKFSVPPPTGTGRVFINLPNDALLLSAAIKDDELFVWALVRGHRETHRHRLFVANTGMPIPSIPEKPSRFLGTVTSSTGIVWHVWDGDADA